MSWEILGIGPVLEEIVMLSKNINQRDFFFSKISLIKTKGDKKKKKLVKYMCIYFFAKIALLSDFT